MKEAMAESDLNILHGINDEYDPFNPEANLIEYDYCKPVTNIDGEKVIRIVLEIFSQSTKIQISTILAISQLNRALYDCYGERGSKSTEFWKQWFFEKYGERIVKRIEINASGNHDDKNPLQWFKKWKCK